MSHIKEADDFSQELSVADVIMGVLCLEQAQAKETLSAIQKGLRLLDKKNAQGGSPSKHEEGFRKQKKEKTEEKKMKEFKEIIRNLGLGKKLFEITILFDDKNGGLLERIRCEILGRLKYFIQHAGVTIARFYFQCYINKNYHIYYNLADGDLLESYREKFGDIPQQNRLVTYRASDSIPQSESDEELKKIERNFTFGRGETGSMRNIRLNGNLFTLDCLTCASSDFAIDTLTRVFSEEGKGVIEIKTIKWADEEE